jgi:uncharacterized oxidoreductase
MEMTGNTILITGGGSGIGKALAVMFHQKGNKVIIAGRREAVLDEVKSANPGIETRVLDITDPSSIERLVSNLKSDFPELNAVVHNAGMMKPEVIGEADVEVAEATITTNLTGQIRLNSALLPHLKQQAKATIITVSSGLAFLPRADFPTYCATKAAIHSYTQSLRSQLSNTNVQVIEIIPPYVQTELQGPEQAKDSRAMPLADFINETTEILASQTGVREVTVERVGFQRTAESSGEYDDRYKQFNERFGLATD